MNKSIKNQSNSFFKKAKVFRATNLCALTKAEATCIAGGVKMDSWYNAGVFLGYIGIACLTLGCIGGFIEFVYGQYGSISLDARLSRQIGVGGALTAFAGSSLCFYKDAEDSRKKIVGKKT